MPYSRSYIAITATSMCKNSLLFFSLGMEKRKKKIRVVLVFLFLLFSLLTARQLEVEFWTGLWTVHPCGKSQLSS